MTINWGKSTLWWLSRNLGGYYISWRRSQTRTLLNRTETRKEIGWTIFTHYHQRKTLHKGCSVLQVLLTDWKWSRIVGNLQFLIKGKCIWKPKARFSNLNNLMTPNLKLGLVWFLWLSQLQLPLSGEMECYYDISKGSIMLHSPAGKQPIPGFPSPRGGTVNARPLSAVSRKLCYKASAT